jgi:hypothetical protein
MRIPAAREKSAQQPSVALRLYLSYYILLDWR